MNPRILQFFNHVESRLLESPAFKSYQIISREIAFSDGKLRIKCVLRDDGDAEFFVYVSDLDGQLHLQKYSFHWQDAQAQVIRRWDNAPHYPDLPNAPHHVHASDGSVSGAGGPPDIFNVIREIEDAFDLPT